MKQKFFCNTVKADWACIMHMLQSCQSATASFLTFWLHRPTIIEQDVCIIYLHGRVPGSCPLAKTVNYLLLTQRWDWTEDKASQFKPSLCSDGEFGGMWGGLTACRRGMMQSCRNLSPHPQGKFTPLLPAFSSTVLVQHRKMSPMLVLANIE